MGEATKRIEAAEESSAASESGGLDKSRIICSRSGAQSVPSLLELRVGAESSNTSGDGHPRGRGGNLGHSRGGRQNIGRGRGKGNYHQTGRGASVESRGGRGNHFQGGRLHRDSSNSNESFGLAGERESKDRGCGENTRGGTRSYHGHLQRSNRPSLQPEAPSPSDRQPQTMQRLIDDQCNQKFDRSSEQEILVKFGYFISKSRKCGFVSFEDDQTALTSSAMKFKFDINWVHQLGIQIGDRLKYQIPIHDQDKQAQNLYSAPYNQKLLKLVSAVIKGEEDGDHEDELIYIVSPIDQVCERLRVPATRNQSGVWGFQRGDQVKLLLTMSDSKTCRYDLILREPSRISTDFSATIECLAIQNSSEQTLELISMPSLWIFIGQTDLSAETLLSVFKFLIRAADLARPYYKSNLSQCILQLITGTNFRTNDGPVFQILNGAPEPSGSLADSLNTLVKFSEIVIEFAPQQSYQVISVCAQLYSKHLDSDVAFRLAKLLCKNLMKVPSKALCWHELPITIQPEELDDSSESLSFSPHDGSCDSCEQYLSANLNRLRAEFFKKFHSDVSQFKRDPLSNMSWSIFGNVQLRGFDITEKEISLLLHLEPFGGKFKKEPDSSQLFIGNLICLSFDETFTDIVWATVSCRNFDFLEQSGLILVALCSDLDGNVFDTRLLRRLQASSGHIWLADSSKDFLGYKRVFTCLQSLHNQPLTLVRQLLDCNVGSISATSPLKPPKSLDPSQVEAFNTCLASSISVISGPSGSGKTFLAAHLVSALSKQQDSSGTVLFVTNSLNSLKTAVSQINCVDSSLQVRLISEYLSQRKVDHKADAHAALLTRLNKAVESICSQLQVLLDLENLEFTDQFLQAYWSKESIEGFCSKCPSSGTGDTKTSLGDALVQWMPSINDLESIRDSCLRMEASSEIKPNHTDPTFEDSSFFIFERCGMPTLKDTWQKLVETKVHIHFSQPSGFKFEKRMKRITSAKWRLLQHVKNPWELSVEERYFYMQGCMLDYIEKCWAEARLLDARLAEVLQCQDSVLQIIFNSEAEASRESNVVAMTIASACANLEFLKKLRPSTVIVDEASLIMEPILLGCLGDWTKRLYLIGDPNQLKANCTTHEASIHLNLSMMERLVKIGFPITRLQYQNRMHPDVSKYLTVDLWPDMKSNELVVSTLQKPVFMDKSVVFWDVQNLADPNDQKGCLGKSNELIVKLALVYLELGYKPSQITILTLSTVNASGITRQLSKIKKNKQLSNKDIEVQAIIDFEGSENDIVIIQLAGLENKYSVPLWHLRLICQTRARCALVFVGIAQSLRESAEWKPFLQSLENEGALSCNFPVICRKHDNHVLWNSISDLRSDFCSEDCLEFLPCGMHCCNKKCQPWHGHDRCNEQRTIALPCGHTETVACSAYGTIADRKCLRPCERYLPCGHKCSRLCSQECDPNCCTEMVNLELSCGHHVSKLCNQPNPVCSVIVKRRLECGHFKEILCVADRINTVQKLKCMEPCKNFLPCKHQCVLLCHEVCNSVPCPVSVSKSCLFCGQTFTSKCGDNKSQCDRQVRVKLDCGHHIHTKCSLQQQEKLKLCNKLCDKKLSCDHKCTSPCGVNPCPPCVVPIKRDNCNHDAHCWERESDCQEVVVKKFKCGHLESMTCGTDSRRVDDRFCSRCWPLAIRARKDMLATNAPQSSDIKRTRLNEHSEETSVEYFKIHDRVMRYIKSEHGISVQIQSIERIENPVLDKRLFDVYEHLFKKDCSPELFFHGTRSDAAEAIIRDGFRVGQSGMYGAGIYFATDTTKSAQYCRESGTKSLLLCEVLLGKSMVCTSPRNDLNLQSVKAAGYDSVFAKRGTKNTQGVMNDEYIVYRAEQAAPRYLVRFT